MCGWVYEIGVVNMTNEPVYAIGHPNVVAVATGKANTYALVTSAINGKAQGAVYSFGANTHYELGSGTVLPGMSATLTLWENHVPVTAITAGDQGACALLSDGSVQCWGVIATSPSIIYQTPTQIALPGKATQIVQGARHACALVAPTDGSEPAQYSTLWCWGDNDRGQLGDPSSAAGRATPYQAPMLQYPPAYDRIAAAGATTCAEINQGVVQCWGDDARGSVGHPATASLDHSATPQQAVFPDGTMIDQLVGGGAGTFCAHVQSASSAASPGWHCWGANDKGQSGLGYLPPAHDTGTQCGEGRQCPTQQGVIGATSIALGTNHSCVGDFTKPSTMMCFGDDTHAQLGDGATASELKPVYVAIKGTGSTANFTGFAMGENHTCAITDQSPVAGAANLACWGANDSAQSGATSGQPTFIQWFNPDVKPN
jgi:alpha-tubulin suppressor-like RCC1 family protein